jgi:hypothetical protein
LKLRLEKAEVETLLARRKEAAGPLSDAVRKEIARLDDRLAVAMARQKVVDQELERVSPGSPNRQLVTRRKLDLTEMTSEIAMLEESSRKVAAEVERLNVELGAPPRALTIEDATPPKSGG